MARRVVLGKSRRCQQCHFTPRWCICEGFQPVQTPFEVAVLIHHREYWRPTSTGRLIERVIPTSRSKIFRSDAAITPEGLVEINRPLWILHPNGDVLTDTTIPDGLQVLLIDGSWREAGRMTQAVQSWGRRISLPMTSPSRFWLRDQQRSGHVSTIEALLFLLRSLGQTAAYEQLLLQFELHVYAGLRTRGNLAGAEAFLATSPIRDAFPTLLSRLAERRPLL